MQEILFWLIVIPVMSIVAWKLVMRQWRQDYPLSSGAVDYKRLPPTWQSGVVADDAVELHYSSPYIPATCEDRGKVIWQNTSTTVAMIESERSEPPQGGSVLSSGKLTMQEISDNLALYFDAQNRPYVGLKPTPSTGYTPLLSDDPYKYESEDCNDEVLKLQSKPDGFEVAHWMSYQIEKWEQS